LGIRIAKILSSQRSQETKLSSSKAPTGNAEVPKIANEQVIKIHCSPFLRCLQTSIGISAGIAQQSPHVGVSVASRLSESEQPESKARRPVLKEGPLSSIIEPDDEDLHAHSEVQSSIIVGKPTLRIDSFLGEWLSPDYYEHITPPPSSALMLVSAKAEMLVDEQVEVFEPTTGLAGNFPGGWSRNSFSDENAIVSTFSTQQFSAGHSSTSGHGASSRHRASSYSQLEGMSGHPDPVAPTSSSFVNSVGTYNPPAPTYAISPSDPIPRGYVAHARDACIEFDCSWDSMKEPQDWGDSGQYGEEWSAMHKRFRSGLAKMVAWYASSESHPDQDQELLGTTANENNELILVLVTHAAGCNALVGALTNQPVLIDFGQASLTMAVRKHSDRAGMSRTTSHSFLRRSSIDTGLSEEYEIKTLASSDHLRVASVRPPFASRVPFRLPFQSPSSGSGIKTANHRNSSLGSIRRNASVPSPHQSDSTSVTGNQLPRPSPGLWTKPSGSSKQGGVSETSKQTKSEQTPLWGTETSTLGSSHSNENFNSIAPDSLWKVASLTNLNGNLQLSPDSESGPTRELGPKRRWTTNQADA
jgi:hypothetical protein